MSARRRVARWLPEHSVRTAQKGGGDKLATRSFFVQDPAARLCWAVELGTIEEGFTTHQEPDRTQHVEFVGSTG